MAMTPAELERYLKRLEEAKILQKEMESSLSGYIKGMTKVGELQESINHNQQTQVEFSQRIYDLEIERLTASRRRRLAIDSEVAGLLEVNDALEETIALEQRQLTTLRATVREVNLVTLGVQATGKAMSKLPDLAKKGFDWVRGLEALDMSKEIKKTELSMGILGTQSKFFSKGLSDASKSTIKIGVGVQDLAKAQAEYSDNIGRNIQLSEGGLQAMADMAKGTMLGIDGAAQMAGNMELFGLNAESARDMVQETVDGAHRMGANANVSIKELGKALKLAQKYNFKGGVKGMAEMSSYAAVMKIDMDDVAGMAEKVFRPEGAVEMAAKLATMGGEFAKLGDPFQLMFKARNDLAGFTKDVGSAAAELASWNESTQEFEIGGLQQDRMRELAKITGLSVDNLSTMAKQAAKFNKIKHLIPSTFDEKDRELISQIATLDKDTGKYQITINGDTKYLDELGSTEMTAYKNEQKSLEKRAEQAQTFDDAFKNLVLQFKTMGLPLIEALNDKLVGPLSDFQEKMASEGWIDSIKEFASTMGSIVGTLGKFILDNPIKSLITYGFFKVAPWILNGLSLAKGFNMGANAMNGTSSANGTASAALQGGGMIGAAGGLATGALAGVGVGIIAGINEWQENKAAGVDTGENVGRTALVGGGGIAGGALAGAALGALGGPLAPVTVPLGALIGAGLGAWGGDALGDSIYGPTPAQEVNDGIIKFNPQDKFMQMNDGLVASTDKGKIDDLVGGGSGGGKMEFGDLKINGTINLKMPSGATVDSGVTKDPHFIREITRLVQEQLSININGGKLNPNPM